jgi:hypothetical protein
MKNEKRTTNIKNYNFMINDNFTVIKKYFSYEWYNKKNSMHSYVLFLAFDNCDYIFDNWISWFKF